MRVYHGSYTAIEQIDFSFCRRRRDFGKGFYVTKLLSQAEYWATRKGEDNDSDGVVTVFEFDDSFFEDEDIKTHRFKGYSDKWLDFITLNRTNKRNKQAHDYDIIEGPVADDEIAKRVYDYVEGRVSKKQFLSELKQKKPTHQLCFCTMQSLQALELNKEKTDTDTIDIDNNIVQALMTDYGINEAVSTEKYYKSNTYSLIADESSGLYLKPWQEIYTILKKELNFD